jgi:RNA polymerase sigma-70 factor (ECF subfamily)
MHTTPVSLLERLREPGQEQPWNRFVELYTPLLLCWGKRLGLQDADADELVQDVFVTLLKKLPAFTYERGKRFRGWLWTVLKNTWQDRMVRPPARPLAAKTGELERLAGPDELESWWEEEHNQMLARRALELMRREFQENTWKAFCLFVQENRPAAEVAAELGMTENAVYIAVCRVRRKVGQELSGLLD